MAIGEVTTLASGYTEQSTLSLSNIDRAYNDTSSTNYATLSVSSRGGTGTIYFTFDVSSIPQDAIINSVNVKVKYSVSSTTYLTSLTCQAYKGTTAMGTATTKRSTTATVYTLNVGTWTRTDLDTFRIFFSGRRGVLGGTTSMYVYGMELIVNYFVPSDTNQLSIKTSGEWKYVQAVYKKVNSAWVEQTDLESVFDTNMDYVRIK